MSVSRLWKSPRYVCCIFLVGICLFGFGGRASAQDGGTLIIAPGFAPDPLTLRYFAGGFIKAQDVYGKSCQGFISAMPDHQVRVLEPFAWLSISVISEADTMLVIKKPDGDVFCTDDSHGHNPHMYDRGWPEGIYEIYVGSKENHVADEYELRISEFRPEYP